MDVKRHHVHSNMVCIHNLIHNDIGIYLVDNTKDNPSNKNRKVEIMTHAGAVEVPDRFIKRIKSQEILGFPIERRKRSFRQGQLLDLIRFNIGNTKWDWRKRVRISEVPMMEVMNGGMVDYYGGYDTFMKWDSNAMDTFAEPFGFESGMEMRAYIFATRRKRKNAIYMFPLFEYRKEHTITTEEAIEQLTREEDPRIPDYADPTKPSHGMWVIS